MKNKITPSQIPIVILCGGKGTRLKEKTEALPKPLIEIGNRPILWHIMEIYSASEFHRFILCRGDKSQLIKEYFMEWQNWKHADFQLEMRGKKRKVKNLEVRENWEITFADTGEETNTGGRIKKIAPLIKEKTFMVTYGDGVADINILSLLKFHKDHQKKGTVTAVKPPSQFGLLGIGPKEIVTSFREKPKIDQWINGGFFIFEKSFLNYLGDNDVLEQKPLERLTREKQLAAYRHDGFWKCMDTYKDTITLNETWASGKAPWKVWPR